MPLLIDGHNVIGSGVLENISLQDENDEERFVQRLRVWRSNYRGDVTVVFDRGIVGGASRELSGAGVEVIFARNPQEADDWIRRRIQRRQQGLIVVTNDWALRQEAKLHDVETWQTEEFVSRMQSRKARSTRFQHGSSHEGSGVTNEAEPDAGLNEKGAESQVNLSEQEVSEWMDLFGPSEPAAQRPVRVDRKPPSPSRATFSRQKNALRKRLEGKRRRR